MHFKRILSFALVLTLGLSSTFASGNPHKGFEVGELSGKSGEAKEAIALKFMERNALDGDVMGSLSVGEFKVLNKFADELGLSTVRLQQYYGNYPIFGSDQIVNIDSEGVVRSYIGETIKLEGKLEKKLDFDLTKKEAIDIAFEDLGFKPNLANKVDPQIVVYTIDEQPTYTYMIELVFDNPTPGRWFYFIDADNGNIVNKYNTISTAKPVASLTFNPANTAIGSGTDVLGNRRSVTANRHTDGKYYLADMTRGKGIMTYNANYSTRLPGTIWSDADNQYNMSADRTAVSSQANLGIVYDYYKAKFNRNSFDNYGAQIKSSVHVGSAYNNAYWNGTQFAFGDGDGDVFIPLSGALDVVAHEYTHAVTSKTANLIYQNESGALNEAMSDIMGTAVEFYANDNPDWLCGEDIAGPGLGTPALRSLEDPAEYGDPDHYSKIYTGTQDNGGVHTNSSVINKVAYLIGNGGTHYGITVEGQGVEAMEKIFYRALTTYMTSSTNFSGAKLACRQAAIDLYGAYSPEVEAVQDAFTACGIN